MPAVHRFLVAATLLLASTLVSAQATRTWVSGVGDDVNPCSRTAPCKTFAGAISKTAAGGVISVLDPGGYGSVTITKSITIDGGGIEGSILASGTTGVIVNVGAADHVILRNLTIFGAGTGTSGIRVLNASGHVTIERSTISGFDVGIEHIATGQIYLYDSSIINNDQFGMYVTAGRATVDLSRFEENGYEGLRAWGGRVSVRRSVSAGHTQIGFAAVGSGSSMSVDDCQVSHNAWGLASTTGASMTVNNTSISDSSVQALYRDGTGGLLSFGNNRFSGNAAVGTFSGSASLQ